MAVFFFFCFFIVIVLATLGSKAFVRAKEDELLVVFRLEKLLDVYGPGLSILMPFLDRAVRVKVETIAGWENLSESELKQKAAEMVVRPG